ncbi:MAG: FHA domain-containing protein [Deltaproteobacteria bacterium]|nr:FHA domain-containing protein [Deltaproteobacteria bacterium]
MRQKLGEVLVAAGLLTPAQVKQALDRQRRQPGAPKLGEVIVALGLLSEQALLKALADTLRLPAIDLTRETPQRAALVTVAEADAKRLLMLPVRVEVSGSRRRLVVAVADPTNLQAIDDLQFQSGMVVQQAICPASQVRRALAYYYEQGQTGPLPIDQAGAILQEASGSHSGREETWVGARAPAAPVAGPSVAELQLLRGPKRGTTVTLAAGQSLVFGRGEQADVVIADMHMSRRHFVVVDSGAAVEVVDLGSRNGVRLNERPVKRGVLKSGDHLGAGDTLIQVTLRR